MNYLIAQGCFTFESGCSIPPSGPIGMTQDVARKLRLMVSTRRSAS
ncbi:MAG: hypothetical protein ACJAVR_000939 [Paracoccaceae bacterium]|jgi:hypothetical protein